MRSSALLLFALVNVPLLAQALDVHQICRRSHNREATFVRCGNIPDLASGAATYHEKVAVRIMLVPLQSAETERSHLADHGLSSTWPCRATDASSAHIYGKQFTFGAVLCG